jgi:NADH:ubiquinone oxidoreductase subunit F (NADH-binding)
MGHRGIPQLRPPYPAERGLFGRPTLVNNVETFANVPWILREGPERFAALGCLRCSRV